MLLKEFLKNGTEKLLSLYPEKEARNLMLLLCDSRLGTKSYTHIVEPEFKIKDKDIPSLDEDMSRLLAGEPIQYVLGSTEFFGFNFRVTKDVLIPRPETEMLCTEAVKTASRLQRMREAYGKDAKPVKILDLCTGSGCIAWSVALSVPGVEVVATDISAEALKVADGQDFAKLLKEKKAVRPVFVLSDVLDLEQQFNNGPFDIILSNPPYVAESEKVRMHKNVLDFEPSSAIFVNDENPLIFYNAIAAWSSKLMTKEGVGISEINERFGKETCEVFKKHGYGTVRTIVDLFDKNRFVVYSK